VVVGHAWHKEGKKERGSRTSTQKEGDMKRGKKWRKGGRLTI
jgi:hypothetical protein